MREGTRITARKQKRDMENEEKTNLLIDILNELVLAVFLSLTFRILRSTVPQYSPPRRKHLSVEIQTRPLRFSLGDDVV